MAPRTFGAVAAGGIVLSSARRARRRAVDPAEERVFRAVNGLPGSLLPPVWAVMQMGSLGAVFAASGALRQRSLPQRAVAVAAVGTAVWGGVKLVKPLVGRGRPAAHLDDVVVRGQAQSGLGFPSGHAAVSLTLALLAPTTPTMRRAALAGAGLTATGRVYVGAHLPLDVVGGAAIGWLAGHAGRRWLGAARW